MKWKVHNPSIVFNRIGAILLDMFIISVIYGAIIAISTRNYKAIFDRFNVSSGDYRLDFTLAFVLMLFYFVLVPFFWNGRTIGKRMTHLRLVKQNGERLDVATLLVRFLVLLLPTILLLGFPAIILVYMLLLRYDNRGYHDLLARTRVKSTV